MLTVQWQRVQILSFLPCVCNSAQNVHCATSHSFEAILAYWMCKTAQESDGGMVPGGVEQQAAQESDGVMVPGGVEQLWRYGTEGHDLVDMVGMGWHWT